MRHLHLRIAVRSMWVQVLGILLFVLVASVIDRFFSARLEGPALFAVGLLMALIPASLWFSVFYQQDSLEPEPKAVLLGVFLLAALLAQAVGQPLIGLFGERDTSLLGGLLLSVLVVGVVQEFLKYAAVRYTVYTTSDFDHRVDGVIYGASAGLGYATLLNLHYIVSNGGVDLGTGAIRLAVTALAHASFGGLSGYFLGRAKFDRMGLLWLPAGVGAAALLNGVVSNVLRDVPFAGGLHFSPLLGLLVALVVVSLTFTLIFSLTQTLTEAEARGQA